MNDDVLAALAAANPVPAARLDLDAGLRDAIERGRSGSQLPRPPARGAGARLGALAALATLVAVASALALGQPTVNFFSAKKAPRWEFVEFARLSRLSAFLSGRPLGPRMQLAARARVITDVRFGGHDHVLVVAPLKNGGICRSWSGGYLGSTCGPAARGTPLQIDFVHAGTGPVTAVDGIVYSHAATELWIKFKDGTSSTIPVVWVSKPIDAGFFLYSVAGATSRPVELELLSAGGKALATSPVRMSVAPQPPVYAIAGFGRMAVPSQAVYGKRRLLFQVETSVPSATGTRRRHIGLWVAPKRGGGTCTWTNGAGLYGCSSSRPALPPLPITPNFFAGTLCCRIGAGVARVELRFQDGKRMELQPKDGFLLAAIPLAQYPRGHRLREEVAYDKSGKVLEVRTLSASRPGQYPCAHPNVHMFGMTLCR